MNKEDVMGYTNRVVHANKSELIVILYDIVLQDVQEARDNLTITEISEFQKCCDHSLKAINELMVSLDFQYEISEQLFQLYTYVKGLIAKVKTKKEDILLVEAYNIMEKLRSSFVQVASQDKSEAVMQNTEQVYAGLTYSKGNLNESLLEDASKRGFRA